MTRIVCALLLLFVSLLTSASEYTFSPKEIPALKQLIHNFAAGSSWYRAAKEWVNYIDQHR